MRRSDPNVALKKLISNLEQILIKIDQPIVAVSGGVDSMTLSYFSHKILGYDKVKMVHAISPAVPESATARTRAFAKKENWNIEYIDAGEFSDPNYRENPVNRCYFCKSNLYKSLSELADGNILSGTNIDDLSDFRPGLNAASEYNVRHPYVESKFTKANLRALAQHLGLEHLAKLPSSPCLASRVETGIRIQKEDLKSIDYLEEWIKREFSPGVVRCRLRKDEVFVELNSEALKALSNFEKEIIEVKIFEKFGKLKNFKVKLGVYQKGSAFIRPGSRVLND